MTQRDTPRSLLHLRSWLMTGGGACTLHTWWVRAGVGMAEMYTETVQILRGSLWNTNSEVITSLSFSP